MNKQEGEIHGINLPVHNLDWSLWAEGACCEAAVLEQ